MARFLKPKRILLALIVLVVAFVALVALLPTLVSAGLGRGMIVSAIDERVNGDVRLDAIKLGWFSNQSVRGLKINEAGGREAVNVDVAVDAGLLTLLLGPKERLGVDVTGKLAGDVRADGSTSFGDLFAGDKKKDKADKPSDPRPGGEPPSLGAVGLRLTLTAMTVALDVALEGAPPRVVLDNMNGHVEYTPGGKFEIELDTATTAGDLRGAIAARASGGNLFDADGTLTTAGAALTASLDVSGVPLPAAADTGVTAIESFKVGLSTTDLAAAVNVTLDSVVNVGTDTPSTLGGRLTLKRPVTPAGKLVVGLDTVQGTLDGRAIPTAMLAFAVADTPFVLARDVGPRLDVNAALGADEPGVLRMKLTSARMSVEMQGAVNDDGSVEGSGVKASVDVQPALLAALVGGASPIAEPALVTLTIESFRLPPRGDDGALPLADVSFAGSVTLPPAVRVTVAGRDAPIAVNGGTVGFSSAALRSGAKAKLGAEVEGGRIDADVTVARLIADDGSFAVPGLGNVRGTITTTALPTALLASFMPDLPLDAPRDLGPSIDMRATLVDGAAPGDPGRVDLTLTGANVSVKMRGALAADGALTGDELTARADVQPALVAGFTGGTSPVKVPVRVDVTLSAFHVPAPGAGGDITLAGRVKLPGDVTVEHASLAAPAVVRALFAEIDARIGAAATYAARGNGVIRDTGGKTVARLGYDLTARSRGDALVPGGTVTLGDLDVAGVERLAGTTPELLTGWLGASGTVAVKLKEGAGVEAGSAQVVDLNLDLPRVKGDVTASLADDTIAISSAGIDLSLAREVLARTLLATPGGEGDGKGGGKTDAKPAADPITIAADVPLRVAIPSVRIPLAALRGEPFDSAATVIDARVTGGPVRLTDKAGLVAAIKGLSVAIASSDVAAGITFELKGKASGREIEGASGAAGTLAISGSVIDVVNDTGALDAGRAKLTMDATVDGVPTSIADAALGQGGLLVASVGPTMKAIFKSSEFSRSSGWIDGRLDTAQGFVEARLRAADGELRTTNARPLIGALEITPALRDRLLEKIHPVLADIRTTEQPVRIAVDPGARIPTDGDVSKLKTDLEITVGKVEFTSGSTMLQLMKLFAQSGKSTIPGTIEPIRAKVRDGIVTYERFIVRIDKYQMAYGGRIDLVKQTIDLRTEVPLAALTTSFRELEGYGDKIIVPLVTRGSFDDHTTKLDPDFDIAGAAVKAGFSGVINDLLKKQGGESGDPLRGVFDNLLGGKDDPPAKEEPKKAPDTKKKKKKD